MEERHADTNLSRVDAFLANLSSKQQQKPSRNEAVDLCSRR